MSLACGDTAGPGSTRGPRRSGSLSTGDNGAGSFKNLGHPVFGQESGSLGPLSTRSTPGSSRWPLVVAEVAPSRALMRAVVRVARCGNRAPCFLRQSDGRGSRAAPEAAAPRHWIGMGHAGAPHKVRSMGHELSAWGGSWAPQRGCRGGPAHMGLVKDTLVPKQPCQAKQSLPISAHKQQA